MTPTAILRDEHRVILKALDILDATAARLAVGDAIPEALWSALLDWLQGFADARHHAKEEQLLFPALIRAGLPSPGGPVDVMLEEHEIGRDLVRAMAQGGPVHRATETRRYTALLRDHIAKEDTVLFPLADELLPSAEIERLRREFERADAERGRAQSIAAAQAVLDGLATALEAFLTAR